MAIHVQSLGGLKVVQDGTEREALPGQPLRCALLLHLAVEGRATRESVTGLLWPDRAPDRARHSLSQTLYELRRDLGEDCIETKAEVLHRGPSVERVDAKDFEEAANAGHRERALDLYRGRFLEGVHLAPTREFESWADRVRSRLHRLHRKTRSEHVTACMEEGRIDDALVSARRWLELDALDDEAQHHVIRLLAESGRRSEALRQYERYRELVGRELDVEPLEETRELVGRIRDGGVEAATSPPVPPAEGPPDEETAEEAAAGAPGELGPGRPGPTHGDRQPGAGSPSETRAEDVDGASTLRVMVDEARLPRVLVFYLVASFAALQAVDVLIERLRLPETLFAAALVLVIAGLPVVVTTALIQAGALRRLGRSSAKLPRRWMRASARWFTWRNAALGGLAAVAAWTSYAFLFTSSEPVAPEAEVIAVLPFTVSGSGVEDFGKGIVSLLGPNLDGIGGIRTINARTVIHRWEERGEGAEPDFEEALQIGREVGAGSVILGSVVSLGDRVRLLAELHSVDGERLARADAEGPLPEVLTLVDSLTVHLVRNVWRSREPIPDLRVSAVTTGSLDAMRAFFRGEELYRRSRWDAAADAFRRAVELDSTFALAHFRSADSEIWASREFTQEALAAMESAYRHREKLPRRARTLLVASRLDLDGDVAASDTMEAYVRRYPEDGEGWFYLGDYRFHARRLEPVPSDVLYRPFERAMEFLPTFTPALIHPLEWSLVRGDSLRFHRYLGQFRDRPGGRDGEPYAGWGRILWGPADSTDLYLDRTLGEVDPSGWPPLLAAIVFDPDLDPSLLLEALGRRLRTMNPDDPGWLSTTEHRLELLGGLGRLAALREELDLLWEVAPDRAALLELRPVAAGIAPPDFARRAVEHLEDRGADPEAAFWLALHDLAAGEVEAGRERIRTALGTASSDTGTGHLLEAAAGWVEIAVGDTVSGLERLERGLMEVGYWSSDRTGILRHVWARTLAAYRPTRDEGFALLRSADPNLEVVVLHRLVLARTLEEIGDREGAHGAYADVLRLAAGADPELEDVRAEARRALERLEVAAP